MASLQTPYKWDRVEITVDGELYGQYGSILRFSAATSNNSKLIQAMSSNGLASGIVEGNSEGMVHWTEILQTAADYRCWRTFLSANPNSVIGIIPITLGTGQPLGPNLQITGLVSTGQTFDAAGEGQEIISECSFRAVLITNLNG